MSSVYDSRFGSISIPAQLSLTYLALGAWVEGFPLQPPRGAILAGLVTPNLRPVTRGWALL